MAELICTLLTEEKELERVVVINTSNLEKGIAEVVTAEKGSGVIGRLERKPPD